METRYFRTLVAVVEMGSFSKAAKSLHVTQSAISQRIKFLEEAFGHLLFDRKGVALNLTSVGEIVLDSARQILHAEVLLAEQLAKISNRQKIKFCCTSAFGTVYLPIALKCFMADSSNAHIDLNFSFHNSDQALVGILNKEFDVSVIEHCLKTDLSMFKTYPLPDDDLIFVTSPSLNFNVNPCTVEDLFQFTLFIREDGCSSRQLLLTGLEDHGKSLSDFSSVVTSDDLQLTCEMVLSGGGVSLISSSLVKEYIDSGQMVAHEIDNFPQRRQRKIVIEKGREKEEMLIGVVSCIHHIMDVSPPQ